jgi:hypothetical protein
MPLPGTGVHSFINRTGVRAVCPGTAALPRGRGVELPTDPSTRPGWGASRIRIFSRVIETPLSFIEQTIIRDRTDKSGSRRQRCAGFPAGRTLMTLIQKVVTALMPKTWADDMRRESLGWMQRCTCGHEISVWDAGGIRWKAKGSPKRLLACPGCGKVTVHSIYKRT